MKMKERTKGDVMILDIKGKIVLSEGDIALKDKIHSLVGQGHKNVVLDLADVTYIDSSAPSSAATRRFRRPAAKSSCCT